MDELVRQSKAVEYAQWCIQPNNDKVPIYVKRQAIQWLAIADGKNAEAYVDVDTLAVVSGLLKIMVHPDLHCSMYEGLEDYAWLLIVAALCTMSQDGSRYYQTVLLEISRKNFKTFNSAVIFILLMLTEPKFGRFFSVAPDLALSSELKMAIRKIIKSSPLLYNANGKKHFELLRSEIRCDLTESTYVALAYSKDGMDGKQANAFLADEAGALDEYPVEAMRSSQLVLINKLGIIISTQYPNDNNVMIDEIDIAKKTLDGLFDINNTRVFALLYEPDDALQKDEVWQIDDRVIYQANPVSVHNKTVYDDLLKKRTMAIYYENKRENFLCKHCNIRYKGLGVEGYIDVNKVKRCKIPKDDAFWQGKRVWLGLDLSQSDDNTAVAMVTMYHDEMYARVWGFIPEEKLALKEKKEHVDYRKLIRQGCCFACGGEVIDYGFVEEFILNLPKTYGVEIAQVGYDRYNAISTINKLEANGIECVQIKQHSSVLHPATKYLKERILQQLFHYEENLMLEINFSNARCVEDTNKNKYVNKKKSNGKVDMVVALIDAVYLVQQEVLFGYGFFVYY